MLVTAEEALRRRVPVLMIDVKGDRPDLLLAVPSFDASELAPWVDAVTEPGDDRSPEEIARAIAKQRQDALTAWGIGQVDLRKFHDKTAIRVITPAATGRGNGRW